MRSEAFGHWGILYNIGLAHGLATGRQDRCHRDLNRQGSFGPWRDPARLENSAPDLQLAGDFSAFKSLVRREFPIECGRSRVKICGHSGVARPSSSMHYAFPSGRGAAEVRLRVGHADDLSPVE